MSEAQPQPAPATPAAPAPATPAAPEAPPASSVFDWKATGLSKESLEWVGGKGFKDLNAAFGSHQNLEKDYRQSVKIPGDDAKPEDISKFWARMGRPEKSDDYKLEGYKPPEGGLDLIPWFKAVAHKHNLPAKAFEGVAGEFVAHMKEVEQQEQEQYTAQVQQQMDAVAKEWGPEAAINVRNIQNFRTAFGLSQEDTTEMMLAIGPAKWAKFASKAGSYFAEAKIGGDLPGGGSQFGMTQEAAQAKLDEITRDPAKAKLYANEDPVTVNEVSRLRRIVRGG